jgi:ubiquinone/menaquinone biosynthesis C-methylase UbiE
MSLPMPQGTSYQGSARFYDLLFGATNRWLSRVGVAICNLPAGARVLDLCCGTGSHLDLYRGKPCALFGLDASAAMLAVARGRLGDGAHLDLGDATSLPYADGTFDIVSCKLALHEMPPEARRAVVAEARRVLKADGRILLIDFHPGPFDPGRGWITRAVVVAVEFIAGGEHYKNQRQFIASGGLPALAREQGLRVESQVLMGGGAFALHCLAAA